MKKALLKDSIKEIKNTYKRFISILLMAFLGVGFFAGIKATPDDMLNTIDKYYKDQNVYDIQVISTLGLTSKDVEELSKIENVEQIQGTYETDGKIEIENKEIIAKVMCVNEFNKPLLIEGNLPQNQNECVVEEGFLNQNNKKIGDKITLEVEKQTNDKGEEIDYLKQKELKIVGTIKSPIYISAERGTSSLGAGKVDYYIYISSDNINANEIYTNIYVKVKDANKYITSSKQYEDCIKEVKDKIEEIKEERQNSRKQELVDKANEKEKEAQNELNTKKEDAEKQINEAEEKIKKGKEEIQKASEEISKNEQTANKEFASAQKQIQKAKQELEKKGKEFIVKKQEAQKQFEELEKQISDLQTKLTIINSGIEQVNTKYSQAQEQLKNPELTEEERKAIQKTIQELEKNLQKLEVAKQEATNGINQIQLGVENRKKGNRKCSKTITRSKRIIK